MCMMWWMVRGEAGCVRERRCDCVVRLRVSCCLHQYHTTLSTTQINVICVNDHEWDCFTLLVCGPLQQ